MTQSPSTPQAAWTAVVLLWVAFALNYIDRQIAYSIFPVLRRELGFSELQLGLVGAVFLWSYGAALIFTGQAADRLNRRTLILVSLLLWSGATAGSGLSTSPVLFSSSGDRSSASLKPYITRRQRVCSQHCMPPERARPLLLCISRRSLQV